MIAFVKNLLGNNNSGNLKKTFNDRDIKNICKSCGKSFKKTFGKKLPSKSAESIFNYLIKKEEQYSETSDQYAKKLFKYGKMDLGASELLYNNGFFSLSIYHLQQAIEKITKSYFLYNYLIKIENLKSGKESISHITPKALTLSLKDLDFRKNVEIMFDISNIDKEVLDTDIKNIEKLIEKQTKLAKVPSSEINHVLKDFRFKYMLIKRLNSRDLRFKASLFTLSFIKNLEKVYSNVDLIKSLKIGLSEFEKLPKKQIELNFILMNLYVFSVITFPHFSYTRYPKENKEDLEPDDYDNKLGIIQAYPDMLRHTKSIIKGIENIHKDLK